MLIVLFVPNWGEAASRPSQSSSIVLSPDQKTVCVANQDSGTVSLWNWQSTDEVIEVAVGEEPRTLAVSSAGDFLYVTTQRSQEVSVVSLGQGKCVEQIPLGGQPVGLALSPDGRRAYVAQYAGDYLDGKYTPGAIAVIDTGSRKILQKISVKPHPFALALSADGKTLYVTHYFQIEGTGVVTEVDTETLQVRREIEFHEDEDIVGGSGGVFNALASIALHPTQNRALVAGMHANVRRGLSQSGIPLSHKTTVQAVVRITDLDADRELEQARIISSFSGQAVAVPSAVTFLGEGEHFVDVYFASHDMKVIKYNERGLVAERALLELPDGPTGIAVTHDGKTAFVNCRWSRSVVQVSLADIRAPKIVREIRVTAEPWDEQRILGARVFHNTRDTRMTPNRWLSCGICHLDGGLLSDALVWEFTELEKPTSPKHVNPKSLAITSWSSPPFLITGEYQTIQEEDQFIRSFLGGSGFIEYENDAFPDSPVGKSVEMDAIAKFILSLRPRPNPHMVDGQPRPEILASALRGKDLFHSSQVGCSSCHAGRYLSKSGRGKKTKLIDVGTGITADVPSLRNCWETAPYLHDGRAKTLHEVFTKYNQDNRHGRTSSLSELEINDLANFLLAPIVVEDK